MRNLIYKELKLSWHPICYVFALVFPAMVLIPTYPVWIGFIYVCACYPILFLGANKGQQSNDVFYTALLPVRKKDIVLARIISLAILLLISTVLTFALNPLGIYFARSISEDAVASGQIIETDVGLPRDLILVTFAFVLVAFTIYDFIFLTWFYKDARRIVLSSILGMLTFMAFLGVFVIALPYTVPGYTEFFSGMNIGIQFVCVGIGLLIYIIGHYLTYRVSYKEFEKVDL